jgi:hypothetical protein
MERNKINTLNDVAKKTQIKSPSGEDDFDVDDLLLDLENDSQFKTKSRQPIKDSVYYN